MFDLFAHGHDLFFSLDLLENIPIQISDYFIKGFRRISNKIFKY